MNAQQNRGVAWWLSPLRPLLIGMAALGVALLIASKALPLHTVVVWSSAGKSSLAVSRSDLEVVVLIIALIVFVIWVIAGLFFTVLPVRHILVPNATYWKTAGHGREMKHRYATYLSRAIGFTYWFVAVEVIVAIVSQKNAVLEVAWLPVIVSLLFVVILLVFAVWVFADGFRPPQRPARPRVAGSAGR